MFLSYSFIISIFLIKLNIAQAFEFPTTSQLFEGSNCRHSSGVNGVCKPINECPTNLLTELRKNTCGFKKNTPLLCCPQTKKLVGSTKIGVSSPKIDFECGRRELAIPNFLRKKRQATFIDIDEPRFEINVVGGIESSPNSWPWATLIGVVENVNERRWLCTGTLINHRFVLSAAHCLKESPDIIRLEEHDFNDVFDGVNHKDIKIKNIIIHPEYRPFPAYHDLVLFELETSVNFTSLLSPVCLPWGELSDTEIINKDVMITGWGATEFGGELSSVIMEAQIRVFDASACVNSYNTLPDYTLNWPEGIDNTLYICAGNMTHSVDACGGDSGGPIVYQPSADAGYVLIGVTSKGNGCGNTEFPGLYINLNHLDYLQWIKDTAF